MMPDLEAPELQAWPGLQDVRGKLHILDPGCSVFVPAFWYEFRGVARIMVLGVCRHSLFCALLSPRLFGFVGYAAQSPMVPLVQGKV